MAHKIPVKIFYGGSIDSLAIHPTYPIHSSSAGSWIGVLDACLVSGFGEVTLSSLTIDANGIATATSNAHGYNKKPTIVLIYGADQEAINGEWEITATTTNTITLNTVASGLTSTTITGSQIKLKVAPLGWSRVFYDAVNFAAVYRSNNPLSRRHFLRVDDVDSPSTTPRFTYFRGYEVMSSAQEVGLYPFPLQSSFPRGVGAPKELGSSAGNFITANSANISWAIYGTDKQFYWSISFYQGTVAGQRMFGFFGDLNSYIPGDSGATGLIGTTTFATNNFNTFNSFGSYPGFYSPKSGKRLHVIVDQRIKILAPPGSSVTGYIGTASIITEPDVYSNKIIISQPLFLVDEQNSAVIRGEMPGMVVPLNDLSALPFKYDASSILTIKGKRYIYVPNFYYSSAYGNFLLAFDTDWGTLLT
jgi:hypothetical protein